MRSTPRPRPPSPNPPQPAAVPLAHAVGRARAAPEFLDELRRLYESVDKVLAAQGARCLGGGACCRFDLMGHRLYASTGELAVLTGQPAPSTVEGPAPSTIEGPAPLDHSPAPLRCPYQFGPRCSAYRRRPLGCRLFFCRPGRDGQSSRTYEQFHRRIRQLHESFEVPYLYVELTGALGQLAAGR